MPPTLLTTIRSHLSESAKQNHTGPIACCWCGNQHAFVKYGTYTRHNFNDQNLIKIQRYLCKKDICRRTFSILPHPFLRITQFSICMICILLNMYEKNVSRAEIARRLHMSWPTIHRMITKGKRILDWMTREAGADPVWAPSPCLAPDQFWSRFILMFGAQFYPKRYAKVSSTQHEYRL